MEDFQMINIQMEFSQIFTCKLNATKRIPRNLSQLLIENGEISIKVMRAENDEWEFQAQREYTIDLRGRNIHMCSI